MMEAVVEVDQVAQTTQAPQFVFFFGAGRAEGNGSMKHELGGKGAGLAEMTNAHLPVPPGFTIQTEACRQYLKTGVVPAVLDHQMEAALNRLEALTGQWLGDPKHPLLLSVRSGSKFSMPGMMDTILNLGLNDETTEGLAKLSRNSVFAYDCYRRFIQMFATVVLEIPRARFVEIEAEEAQTLNELARLKAVVSRFKALVHETTGNAFPQDPYQQLMMARDAVFRSWNNDRARHYRR